MGRRAKRFGSWLRGRTLDLTGSRRIDSSSLVVAILPSLKVIGLASLQTEIATSTPFANSVFIVQAAC